MANQLSNTKTTTITAAGVAPVLVLVPTTKKATKPAMTTVNLRKDPMLVDR